MPEQQLEDFLFSELEKYGDIPVEEKRASQLMLQGYAKTRTLEKGEKFVSQGDLPKDMAFICTGIFRVFCLSESGEDKTLAFRRPGQFLSAYSPFINHKETWYSIEALADSQIIYFSLDYYANFFGGHPCWETVVKNYIIALFIEKEDRERSFLLEDATTRYLNFKKTYPEIENEISQYYIASYLGISPVSLSRIRTELKKNDKL